MPMLGRTKSLDFNEAKRSISHYFQLLVVRNEDCDRSNRATKTLVDKLFLRSSTCRTGVFSCFRGSLIEPIWVVEKGCQSTLTSPVDTKTTPIFNFNVREIESLILVNRRENNIYLIWNNSVSNTYCSIISIHPNRYEPARHSSLT
jgi:hypothetical protein